MFHTFCPIVQCIKEGPTDTDSLGSQAKGFHNISSSPKPTVDRTVTVK